MSNDDVPQIVRVEDLVVRFDRCYGVAAFQPPLRLVHGGPLNGVSDVFQRNGERPERCRINPHPDRIFLFIGDGGARNSRQVRDMANHHRIGILVDFAERQDIRGQRHDDDGTIGRIFLE